MYGSIGTRSGGAFKLSQTASCLAGKGRAALRLDSVGYAVHFSAYASGKCQISLVVVCSHTLEDLVEISNGG